MNSENSNHWKMRRLLLSRWRRFTRWEFWPAWAVYATVVPYIFWLGLRHRGLNTFAACNPAIPAGGLLGESKSQILGQIKARESVARFTKVTRASSPGEAVRQAREFMAANKLVFPVVIKPDWGQRGLGVAIIRDEEQLEKYFATPRPDSIVQEYAPGEEFGVFYVRRPGGPRGRIYSITRKIFTCVTGDGVGTLEQLILADDRAVCSAAKFLARNQARLGWVPAAGEKVPLTDIGNHARGTIFLDGNGLYTTALDEAVDRIAKSFDGFFFGRFDLRVPTVADFQAGRKLKVIELNGVTSEATHIYDPKFTLGYARTVLRGQWKLAFEIGAANRNLGAKPPSVWEIAKLLLDYEPAGEA